MAGGEREREGEGVRREEMADLDSVRAMRGLAERRPGVFK